ncbi:carboxypeptidase regulatory-like domain-containing protein [Mumia sp. DW29H23]|uniref:carboxypeptidase regulatory-like domain-containing protein n=1 Tax=Mumia sp. DW29H23 TaxID=3421241 RepID=UPI003D698AD7
MSFLSILPRQRTRVLPFLVALVLSATVVVAAPAQAAETGSISGRVLIKPTDGPATGAPGITLQLSTVNGGDTVVAETETTADGSFSFPDLPDQTYIVRASDAPAPYADEYYGDAWSRLNATWIRLRGEDAVLDEIILQPAAAVRGVVRDEHGDPVPGVTLYVAEPPSNQSLHFTSGPDGWFDTRDADIPALVAGSYTVGVTAAGTNASGYPYDWPTATVTVGPGATSTTALNLSVLSTVDFTVLAPDGKPLAHAPVVVYHLEGNQWQEGPAGRSATDATGQFRSASRTSKLKFLFGVPDGYTGPPAVAEYWKDAYELGDATMIDLSGPESHRQYTVQLGPAPTISAATPAISGVARAGSTLQVRPGRWSPSGLTIRHQWRANGVAVAGATAATFRVTNAQAGKRITVTTSASKTGYATASRTSAATAPVLGTLTTRRPIITGTAKKGKKLKARTKAWGPSPVRLRYQWYRNGKRISKATRSSYRLTKRDVGKRITVKVTGTRTSYATASRLSKKTAKVRK